MDTFWLKVVGGGLRGAPIPNDWRSWANGLMERASITTRRPSMKAGDGIVYYAAGTGLIFAAGEIVSHPYERPESREDANWPWRVDISLDPTATKQFVHEGIRLKAIGVDPKSIRQKGHIRITKRQYDRALQALRNQTVPAAMRS